MQGTIAQLLSIIAHGNQYLAGSLADGYFPNNNTFKFCKFVKFVDLKNSGNTWNETEFATNPMSWYQKLKETGVIQLRARYLSTNNKEISDRMSSVFVGGGGRWLIEAVKLSKSDYWEASWVVGDRDNPDQNIWHVKYGRTMRNVYHPENALPAANAAKEQLRITLQKISAFAHTNELNNFGACFDQAIKALEETTSAENSYSILPSGYASLEFHQLINSCQSAWVFGGMGSWNDLGFDDDQTQEEYEKLSDELFSLVNLALIVASNPFARPVQGNGGSNLEHNKKWWQIWKKG